MTVTSKKVLMVEESGIELDDPAELNFAPDKMPFSASGFNADSVQAALVELLSISPQISNYFISSSTAWSTSIRNNYAQITGFSLTPLVAGKYAFLYSASVYYTTTPKAHYWALHKNGTIVTESQRQQDTAHSNQTMSDVTIALVDCNGSDVIDVRYKCDDTGTVTVNQRTLIAIRLGNVS